MVQSLPNTEIRTEDVVGFYQQHDDGAIYHVSGWVTAVRRDNTATVAFVSQEKEIKEAKIPVGKLEKLENLAYELSSGMEVLVCGGEYGGKVGTIAANYDPSNEWRNNRINIVTPKGVNIYPEEERVQLLPLSREEEIERRKARRQRLEQSVELNETEVSFSCFRWLDERQREMTQKGYTSDDLLRFNQLNESLKGGETLEEMRLLWTKAGLPSDYLSEAADDKEGLAIAVKAVTLTGTELVSPSNSQKGEIETEKFEPSPFTYSDSDQEHICRETIAETTAILQSHTKDYFLIGEKIEFIRTNVLTDFKKFNEWLSSDEWRAASGTRFKVRMAQYCQKMYRNATDKGLSIELLTDKLRCNPTASRQLFSEAKYAESGALDEVKNRIEQGEILNDEAVQEIQQRYNPSTGGGGSTRRAKSADSFTDTGTGCYTCRHYTLENEVRQCALYKSPIKDLEKSSSQAEAPDGGKFKATAGCRNLATGEITVKSTPDGQAGTTAVGTSLPVSPTHELSITNEVFERLQLGARAAALKVDDYLAVVIDKALEGAKWQAECERLKASLETLNKELIAAQAHNPGDGGTWVSRLHEEV